MIFIGASPVQAQVAKPTANAKSGPLRPKNLKPVVRSKETTRAINVGDDTPAPTTGALDREQLQAMLEAMGYEVKVLGEGEGTVFEVNEDGWPLLVLLSPDGTNVWVTQGLGKLPDPAHAPVDKVLGILSWNGADAHFVYFTDSQALWIQRDLANKGVKPAALRKTIAGVARIMTGTYDLWKEGALAP